MVDILHSVNKSCVNNFFAKHSGLPHQAFRPPALDPMRDGTIRTDLQHQTADANKKETQQTERLAKPRADGNVSEDAQL